MSRSMRVLGNFIKKICYNFCRKIKRMGLFGEKYILFYKFVQENEKGLGMFSQIDRKSRRLRLVYFFPFFPKFLKKNKEDWGFKIISF